MRWARGMVLALGLIAASGCETEPTADTEAATTSDSGGKVLYYKSPMDPSFVSDKPGKDAMGMDLVPVREGDSGADLNSIVVDGATIQMMGVRTTVLRKAQLTRTVRALGRIEFDEARVATVNMKFDGWIEKLWVDETGQLVKKGAALFAVYSPELVASQEEFLQILRGVSAGPHSAHLRKAARQRLLQFDVPESFVDGVAASGKSRRRVTIRSPVGGYVVHKTALEGTFVKTGASLFKIADMDALWVIAEVFEFDAPWVFAGQDATIELDYLPGRMQEAKVDYVYPTLDEKTRTLAVRLLLPNPEIDLKQGMFATVRIHTTPVGSVLVIPSEALIRSGEHTVAFVVKGEGRFEPRSVKIGVRGDENYQVLSGLEEGEEVVLSGQFLLDSESQLKAAVRQMLGGNLGDSQAPESSDEGEEHAMDEMGSSGGVETDTGDSGAADAG